MTRRQLSFVRNPANAALWERRFRVPLLIAAAFVIPLVILESLPQDTAPEWIRLILNWGTWGAFAIEFAVMLKVTPDRRRYLIRHPIEIVVVFLTFPPFTVLFSGARLLRILQAARLLRLEPVLTWLIRNNGFTYSLMFGSIVVITAATAYRTLEGISYAESLYWAVSTVTTVGYGDISPMTGEGKALSAVVMIVGAGMYATMAGALAGQFLLNSRPDPITTSQDSRSPEQIEAEILRLTAELRSLASSNSPDQSGPDN